MNRLIDFKKIYSDLVDECSRRDIQLKVMHIETGMCSSTFFKLKNGYPLRAYNLENVLIWLDKELTEYVILRKK